MRVYIQGPQLIHRRLERESPMLWCKMQGQLDSTGAESVDNPQIHPQSEIADVFQVLSPRVCKENNIRKIINFRTLPAFFKKCHICERKHLRVPNPRPKHPSPAAQRCSNGAPDGPHGNETQTKNKR